MSKMNKRTAFYALLAVLILLVTIRYGFSVEIPRIVITGIIIAIALMGDRNEILAIAMCCIPLHEAVDFYIAVAVCGVALVVKSFSSFKIGAPVMLISVIVVWELLHCLLMDFQLSLLITSLIPLIFLAIVLSFDMLAVDYEFIARALAVMSAAVCSICLLNAVVESGFDFSSAIVNLQRLGFATGEDAMLGGKINPNSLGVINVLSMTGLLQLRFLGAHKRIDYALLVILLIFGGLTASRTFLVCLLLMMLLMVLGYRGSIRKKMQFVFALCAFAVVALVMFHWLFPSTLEYYISRFQVEDITTGRDDLMRVYHEYITTNHDVMFFGIGLNDYADRLVNIYRIAWNVPHNFLQEIIVIWGVLGLFMFGSLLLIICLEARRHNHRLYLMNFIPLAIILAKSMAGQLLSSNYTVLALSLTYLSFCQSFCLTQKTDAKE